MRFLDESRERRDRLDEEHAAAVRRAQLHESRFLTEKAREALRDEDSQMAELVALAALPASMSAPDRPVWFPAVSVLTDARSRERQRMLLQGHTGGVMSAEFSPDGTRVVTASSDNTARLWDAVTGAALAVLQGHTGSVWSAAFSPDRVRAVTASDDTTARLWDAATGDLLAVLQAHTRSVWSAAFSPDGARVVTASGDNTARLWAVWPLLTVDTVAYAEISAVRALSREEQASLFLAEADAPDATATADDPGAMCDRLAGDAFDPRKRAPGVLFEAIDAERAVPACQAAVEAAPDEPRLSYQLARALYRADKRDEATALIRAAAEKDYPAAQNDLGSRYENGNGLAKDEAAALRLYRQAAQGGYAPAFSNVGRFYWAGIGVGVDPVQARQWFERGADAGDPFSHRRLAQLYDNGDVPPRDPEKALFHRVISARLFEAAGDEPDAANARTRRGWLARALPPEIAVRIAREAAAWRPKGS